MSQSRRTFVKSALIGGALAAVTPRVASARHGAPTFTKEQFQTLAAMVDRIIPGDETPGALAGGVLQHIDTRLKKDQNRKKLYLEGLQTLQATSRQRFGKAFETVRERNQVNLLKGIEKSEFFLAVREDTIQGFYRSPVGWASIDYPGYHAQPHGYPEYHLPRKDNS